jgi:hypothetical protein
VGTAVEAKVAIGLGVVAGAHALNMNAINIIKVNSLRDIVHYLLN